MRISWPELLGYDIFISYSHTEASAYAASLEKQLNVADLKCFLDVNEAPAGAELEATLEKAVQRSRIFVLVATPSVPDRPWIQREIAIFKSRSTKGTIVPIEIDRAIQDRGEATPLFDSLQKIVWADESRAALTAGDPSPEVIGKIQKCVNFRRRKLVWRRIAWGAALSGIALTGVALYLAMEARQALEEAARQSQRVEAEAKVALAAAQQELAARKRAEASSQSEFKERLTAQAASFERDMNVALVSQYRDMLKKSGETGDTNRETGTTVLNSATIQLENSRTLPEAFRISFPVTDRQSGNVFWHFEHRFFDSRPISKLREQLMFIIAFGLLTPDDERQIANATRTDPVSTVYLIVRYDGDIGHSPFLHTGDTITQPEYAQVVRKAMWMAIASDPEFGYRARLLNDDRLWKEAADIGNPTLLRQVFRELDPNLNDVQTVVMTADYLKAAYWSSAMRDASHALAKLWQLITAIPGIGPADARIAPAQQGAVRALSRLSRLNDPYNNFNEPWGLLAMALANDRQPEAEVTITGVGPPIHRKRAADQR